MPELPEVETIARSLGERLAGLEIKAVNVFSEHVLRGEEASSLDRLKHRNILGVGRRGKMLIIASDGGWNLLFHLKMTGQFVFALPNAPLDKHTHLAISFRGRVPELRFRDVRKFGFMACHPDSRLSKCRELENLGPEPLELEADVFERLFFGRRARVKSLLLDQSFIAGIGNIYANEILFSAGIHPFTMAAALEAQDLRRLWQAVRRVLTEAVRRGGSSIKDFVDTEGRPGSFQLRHRVYGRESQPCRRCQTLIMRRVLSGRSCYFCPVCQPLQEVLGK